MSTPTWGDLDKYHCNAEWVKSRTNGQVTSSVPNPFYEQLASRRYNYSVSRDSSSCRLVFLKGVLKDPRNKTLRRSGRFIWCRNLRYEGADPSTGLRKISFTVDKGKKRFTVLENEALCIPANTFINNNRFFKKRESTFRAFGTVFGYSNTRSMMYRSAKSEFPDRDDFFAKLQEDCPYKPGTLVRARQGYFYPDPHTRSAPYDKEEEYPYGIILAPSQGNSDYCGREFYRVRFGQTTYERVHPVEMEIVNEV
tara:strand:+ start:475 stop:1233 length:759 start_codon:yes stop_codon:yes gene_type:complete